MQVECHSIVDFLANLQGEKIHRKTVFVNRTEISLTDKFARESSSVEVIIQASAIIQFADGDSLVMCGELCGIDRKTGDGGLEGTPRFEKLLERLEMFCIDNGLTVKPGILGI